MELSQRKLTQIIIKSLYAYPKLSYGFMNLLLESVDEAACTQSEQLSVVFCKLFSVNCAQGSSDILESPCKNCCLYNVVSGFELPISLLFV